MRIAGWIAAMLLSLMAPHVVYGAGPEINVGIHQLLPNRAGQVVKLYVSGDVQVEAMEFMVQIADGSNGPILEHVDILGESIFSSNNLGVYPGSYVQPGLAYLGTMTESGYVLGNGLLATLTIDTTGLYEGQYDLLLMNTIEGSTNFADIIPVITNGRLIVVPEPCSLLVVASGIGVMLLRRHRT